MSTHHASAGTFRLRTRLYCSVEAAPELDDLQYLVHDDLIAPLARRLVYTAVFLLPTKTKRPRPSGCEARRVLCVILLLYHVAMCHFWRCEQAVDVMARELIPGDVVLVKSGDRIPADCRLVQAADLFVDESRCAATCSVGASSRDLRQCVGRGSANAANATSVYPKIQTNCCVAVAPPREAFQADPVISIHVPDLADCLRAHNG